MFKPTLTFTETIEAVKAAIEARVAILIEGPPGCGKSALVSLVAQDPAMVAKFGDDGLRTFVASNCEQTDVAGFPVVRDGVLYRMPMQVIRDCAEAPKILFADELTTVPPSVRGPLLRLWLERIAGDLKLDPATGLVAACNAPEHAPAAIELDAATANRFIQVVLAPSIEELRAHIEDKWGLDPADPKGFRDEAEDLAATMRMDASFIQFEPTVDAVQHGAPYGSPRAWERGLRAYSAAGGGDGTVARALLEGAVGQTAAGTYLGIKRLRSQLPTVDAIVANPTAAKVPEKREHQISAMGLIGRVMKLDSYAGWIYVNRLAPEGRFAATRAYMNHPPTDAKKSPHVKAGMAAKLAAMQATRKDID
jgi:MoxR-like ATPase